MTREEELQTLKDFIAKNGVTKLPPDQRGPDSVISPWTKGKKKAGRKAKKAKKQRDGARTEIAYRKFFFTLSLTKRNTYAIIVM